MKRVLAAVLGTTAGLVALLSFKTHPATTALPAAVAPTSSPPAAGGGEDTTASSPGGTSSPVPSSAPSAASSSPSRAATDGTFTGDPVDTRWGPVQVRITVSGGRLTSADAIVYPTENPRDQEINSFAIPALDQEAVSAGSARIDTISGATYTSDGYIQSLQSALDKVGR